MESNWRTGRQTNENTTIIDGRSAATYPPSISVDAQGLPNQSDNNRGRNFQWNYRPKCLNGVTVSRVRDLDFNYVRPLRGGVIVYNVIANQKAGNSNIPNMSNTSYPDKKNVQDVASDRSSLASLFSTCSMDSQGKEKNQYGSCSGLDYDIFGAPKEVRFCFGVDANFGTLSDFGGGVRYISENESVISGALRELEQESNQLFTSITISQIQDEIVIYDQHILIIFLPLSLFKDFKSTSPEKELVSEFRDRIDYHSEMSDIIWLSKEEIYVLLAGKEISREKGHRKYSLYDKVRDLLKKNSHWYNSLSRRIPRI